MSDGATGIGEQGRSHDEPADQRLGGVGALATGSGAQALIEAIRSTALAYDEVLALKRGLDLDHEAERARVASEIQGLHAELATAYQEILALRQGLNHEVERARASLQAEAALSEAHLQRKLRAQRKRADYFEGQCNELLASSSWRVTAPLRMLIKLIARR